MEHVISSHMSRYFKVNNILTPRQHGFHKGFSTETQLISALNDWFTSLDKRRRTDVLLFDFSKAFDTVPRTQQITPQTKLLWYLRENSQMDKKLSDKPEPVCPSFRLGEGLLRDTTRNNTGPTVVPRLY